jgi:adenylylsulfate kinase
MARALETRLAALGRAAYVLDGDLLRRGLCSDLGFSPADRAENIRRAGEVAALFSDAGLIAITAFISPYRAGRETARARVPEGGFIEVFCDAPLSVCEKRDPKGLYKKARAGQVADFTGIAAPYEPPEHAEIVLRTGTMTVEACAERVLEVMRQRGCLSTDGPER